MRRRDLCCAVGAKIETLRIHIGLLEKRKDRTGTLSAEPCVRGYRIRYYLSNEKLKKFKCYGFSGLPAGIAFHFGTRLTLQIR
jgi:hypothetical protein